MKKTLLFAIFTFFCLQIFSATTPSATIISPATVEKTIPTPPSAVLSYMAGMKIKEAEKLLGRKMKLKEKIAFKVYQLKLKKDARRTETKANNGTTAMILGIAGLAAMLIPYVAIAAIPCIILALVFGYTTKKHYPDDKHAKTGIILGWIGVGIIVAGIIALIAIFSNGFWR